MSTSRNQVVTPLSAGHPLASVVATVPVANVNDAAGAAFVAGSWTTITAGAPVGNTQGLTFTGLAAVLSAYVTYIGTLTALKKTQIGQIRVLVTATSVELPVHSADAITFAATLVGVLNTGGNFGTVGT